MAAETKRQHPRAVHKGGNILPPKFEEKHDGEYYTGAVLTIAPDEKPIELVRAEESAEWLRLRARGWSYAEVAKHAGVPTARVYQRLEKVIQDVYREPLAAAVALDQMRLDRQLRHIEDDLDNADSTHERIQLRNQQLALLERRAKLLGLDAPKEVNMSANMNLPTLPGDAVEYAQLQALLLPEGTNE
jgi:hypothetical protein